MIEKLVESAVIAKIAALNLSRAAVTGFWQATATGVPKGREGGEPVQIAVVVSPRSYESFTSAKAQLRVAVTMTVRRDSFPTGAELETFAAPLFDLFETWQKSIAQVRADFTLTDAQGSALFTPHGMRLDGGDVSTDQGESVWIISQTFTLRGVI